jgi:hypothetical protein
MGRLSGFNPAYAGSLKNLKVQGLNFTGKLQAAMKFGTIHQQTNIPPFQIIQAICLKVH